MTPWPTCPRCRHARTTPYVCALCHGARHGEVPGDDPADGEVLEPVTAEALARMEATGG